MKDLEESNIILFQNFEELKEQVEKLRIELSMLVLEKDELKFVECENIETAYLLLFGALEYKVYEAQCSMLKLKRKVELIQASKNRQEKVDFSKIEDILNREFEEYKNKLNDQINKMNKAIERNNSTSLSVEETSELKKLYRKIVKALHPDLNPSISEAQRTMFENAVLAYKSGDLFTLRIINEMIVDNTLPDIKQDAIAQLTEEKKRLENLINGIKNSINKLKSEYPYTMLDIINDSEKTNNLKLELEDILKQYNDAITIYSTKNRRNVEVMIVSDLIKSGNGNGLIGLFNGKGGDIDLPKPFERDIFLFDTQVAGTTYIEGIEEIEPYLNVDDKLEFFREPNNEYDKKAIVIRTMSGVKIGYIPRKDNLIFARLMDAGKLLFGRISHKDIKDDWIRLKIKVFLQE